MVKNLPESCAWTEGASSTGCWLKGKALTGQEWVTLTLVKVPPTLESMELLGAVWLRLSIGSGQLEVTLTSETGGQESVFPTHTAGLG